MQLTLERLIPAIFFFSLVLLTGISVASYQSTISLLKTARLVAHTLEVRDELSATLSALTDAETGQRGFLLTGKEQYLEPYHATVPTLGRRVSHLRQLTVDNPIQQQRLDEVERMATTRLDLLKRSIEMRRSQGAAFIVPVELLDAGRQLMDELRLRISEMSAAESRLLVAREAQSNAAAQRTLFVIPLGSVLAIVVTTLAYFIIRRELARRQRAEAQTQGFTRELERSNRELQDFAYVASHDLQEPLRKIQAFGDLLRAGYHHQLDAEARDFIERMQGAAKRMQVLINDLLTFSRVTTKGQPFASVDLNRIAREVLGDLEVRLQQSGGHIEMGDLPTLEADSTQMRQLLQNLLGNALKFYRPNTPLVVKVSSEIIPAPADAHAPAGLEFCRLTVEDNGIGFDEKYLDRIFTPFQRLHARGQFEGTGIGLAICRRIAERHGGTISARSTPGQGSVFSITLPVKQFGETSP